MIDFVCAQQQSIISQDKFNEKVATLSEQLSISAEVAKLLVLRKIETVQSAQDFLYPDLSQLHDPFLFPQMQIAVDCIFEYIISQKKICIYGDYDVDGVMSTTILTQYFQSVGANVMSFIPSRKKDGYGLTNKTIERVAQAGAQLIITVDCGITNVSEIEFAKTLNIEVIITDHHQMMKNLPDCVAIINPQQNAYPFKSLCGAGVALKLVQALAGIEEASKYFEFAAIATIADIVPLSQENRIIVMQGLEKINSQHCNIGVQQLCVASGYGGKIVDESALAYAIAPRINAAGRTDEAMLSLKLFLEQESAKALKIAKQLDEKNAYRQEIEREIMKSAIDKIDTLEIDIVEQSAIVLFDECWNSGIIGICASKLVEKYNKPVVLFSCNEGVCTGSGRSISGINIFEVLCQMPELFIRFGGHEMAAGMTIKQENIENFRNLFCKSVKESLGSKIACSPQIKYDIAISSDAINIDFIEEINRISPFGAGNPQPKFLIADVEAILPRTIGAENSHIKFSLESKSAPVDVVAFSQGASLSAIQKNKIDFVCNLSINVWNNKSAPQCIARKIKVVSNFKESIQNNEWKFYNAFFEQMRYNDNNGDFKKVLELIQQYDVQSDIITQWVKKSIRGMLILCSTPKAAEQALKFIQKAGIENKFDFAFELFDHSCAYNTVVMAPDFDKIGEKHLAKYKKIIMFDNWFCEETKNLFLSKINFDKTKVYSARKNLNEFVNSAVFSRERLVPVFKNMIAISLKQTKFIDMLSYFECFEKDISKSIICFALKIFQELGFINVSFADIFTITFNNINNGEKKEISQANIYSRIENCLK